MIYDIIPVVANSTGDVIVNATTFSVDCAVLPDAKFAGFYASGDMHSLSDTHDNDPVYSFTFGQRNYTASIAPLGKAFLFILTHLLTVIIR